MANKRSLTDLNAFFWRVEPDRSFARTSARTGGDILVFDCPACPGHHWIPVPYTSTGGAALSEGHPVWKVSGETLGDVTIHPSVDGTKGPCLFHGWVRSGKVVW